MMPPSASPPSSRSTLGMGKAGAAAADGAYEEGVVQALCDAAGLKPVPQEDKLRQFLSDAGE